MYVPQEGTPRFMICNQILDAAHDISPDKWGYPFGSLFTDFPEVMPMLSPSTQDFCDLIFPERASISALCRFATRNRWRRYSEDRPTHVLYRQLASAQELGVRILGMDAAHVLNMSESLRAHGLGTAERLVLAIINSSSEMIGRYDDFNKRYGIACQSAGLMIMLADGLRYGKNSERYMNEYLTSLSKLTFPVAQKLMKNISNFFPQSSRRDYKNGGGCITFPTGEYVRFEDYMNDGTFAMHAIIDKDGPRNSFDNVVNMSSQFLGR